MAPVVSLAPSTSVASAPVLRALSEPAGAFGPLAALLVLLFALAGYIFYYTGLTRAKNSGHTSTLLLLGAVFALIGYWAGGFAVQTGGVGDAHAALAEAIPAEQRSVLDHELGGTLDGQFWGLMGSSGFFLATPDSASRDGMAALFLWQAALMATAVGAALGACLERGRLFAYGIVALGIGVVIYPLFANWSWGGGWLAGLGRDDGLGHGYIDLAGAGVVHETAGTLALVIAVVLGPRLGRFDGSRRMAIPGHHSPYIVLGSALLLAAWMASAALPGSLAFPGGGSSAGTAALNALLGAAAGLLIAVFAAGWRRRRPEPMLLGRGLLGGAIATLGGGALFEPWAAFVIGAIGGLVVIWAVALLELLRIDDPSGSAAVHGAAGAWGVLAVGIFANGAAGDGWNEVAGPVRGAIYSGDFEQILAQGIGLLACFVVVFVFGYAFIGLIHRILHSRVDAAEERHGLDWSETGALGYQPDVEAEAAEVTLEPSEEDE